MKRAGTRTDVDLSSFLPPALKLAAVLMAFCLLQSKEIICQLQEDLMKLLNELYTVISSSRGWFLQEHQALS